MDHAGLNLNKYYGVVMARQGASGKTTDWDELCKVSDNSKSQQAPGKDT
jgi:hypothetical protein